MEKKYIEKKSKILLGLIGNPNVGKTTLFNTLTGARQHVGNWPGKTVEKKEGKIKFQNKDITIVDLPGSYSITAFSEEETVTTDFILQEKPDFVVQVLDAQNLSRNLYLTTQLLELNVPLVLVINMLELARKDGVLIDVKKLETLLGLKVLRIDAREKTDASFLLKYICEAKGRKRLGHGKLKYSQELTDEIGKISRILEEDKELSKKDKKYLSIKLLEGDLRAEKMVNKKPYFFDIKKEVQNSQKHLDSIFDNSMDTIFTNERFAFVKGVEKEVIKRDNSKKKNSSPISFDDIAMNKYLGVPLFILMMFAMFQLTFKLSAPLITLVENLFLSFSNYLGVFFENNNFSPWFSSLIIDGILGGVGGIIVFAPIIGILFMLLALMEDTGYMARVAYVMDKLMHKIGLHGKAFVPMILGFGCNVPGVMATRILQCKKDRLLAILINPFMTCGARLPVYVLFTGIFFTKYQGWVIISLYLLGALMAILAGLVFNKVLFKGLSSPFVIELPPYRCPTLKGVLLHAWENIWEFIKKAGTVILLFSIIIWFLASFPFGVDYASENSYAGHIGKTISPIFEPLGFGNWESSVSLIFGLVAKEMIVSTFGSLYGVGDAANEELSQFLLADFTPLTAFAFMVFVLFYVPCMAVLVAVKKETKSWTWPIFMLGYTTLIAWIMALIVYQGGRLFGLG